MVVTGVVRNVVVGAITVTICLNVVTAIVRFLLVPVVRVGDTVFDGSVANQLSQIRRTAVDQAMQQIRQSLDRFAVDAS